MQAAASGAAGCGEPCTTTTTATLLLNRDSEQLPVLPRHAQDKPRQRTVVFDRVAGKWRHMLSRSERGRWRRCSCNSGSNSPLRKRHKHVRLLLSVARPLAQLVCQTKLQISFDLPPHRSNHAHHLAFPFGLSFSVLCAADESSWSLLLACSLAPHQPPEEIRWERLRGAFCACNRFQQQNSVTADAADDSEQEGGKEMLCLFTRSL